MANEYTIPAGRSKGTPITEATDDDLVYWADRMGKELDAGKVEEKFKKITIERHKAFLAELESRGHAQEELPQTAQRERPAPMDRERPKTVPTETAAIVVSSPDEITGSFRDENEISKRFAVASRNFHLVSPAPSCPHLPEGCSVALSSVVIDSQNETYKIGGAYALSKSALEKISMAAGISWDPQQSGRTDDGSDPHYCSWRAVGRMKHFDGTGVVLIGSKEMDLREGSAQLQALYERYEAAKKAKAADPRKNDPKDPTAQIREMRLHIAAHAESKARLRAIRSLGIRSSYKEEELQKPFVVARLMWTGETSDPVLRDKFAMMQAEAMIGAGRSLYGSDHGPAMLPANAIRQVPPALGTVPVDSDDYQDEGY